MSTSQFAPITSSLLARKGDASPSAIAGRPSLFWRRDQDPPATQAFVSDSLPRVAAIAPKDAEVTPRVVASTPVGDAALRPFVASPPTEVAHHRAGAVTQPAPTEVKVHKIMVALTPVEYEKLGIAAVKKGVTRHHIVRTALDTHFERLKREYGGCGCMANGDQCQKDCQAE